MQRNLLLVLAIGVIVSCNDATGPLRNAEPRPRTDLIDGRNTGSTGFYFLPPLAAKTTYAGVFDPARSPVVEICPLFTGGCGAPIARFTVTDGTGAERVRVDLKSQLYIVNWKTKNFSLTPNRTYRVRVLEGAFELGHTDTWILGKDKSSKTLPAGVIGVEPGSTVPIKFRIATEGGPAVRLEIHPGSFLLTGAGQTQPLEAIAFDAQGRPTGGQVTWTSSHESVLIVSADGVAHAVAATGSSQVTARIGSVVSAPALGLVAQPPAGAMLVSDAEVVGTIVPLDVNALYVPGWQYRIRLLGVNPAIGQILLSRGEAPVGGRVVSAVPVGAEVEVVLALLPLRELFPNLSINESMSLNQSEVAVSALVLDGYSVQRQPSGTLVLEPRSHGSFLRTSVQAGRLDASSSMASANGFALGPFECTVDTGIPIAPDLGSNPGIHIDPDLSLDLIYTPSNGLEKLIVRGGLDAGITFSSVFPVAMEEKLECKAKLGTITLPIGGPLALFIGGQVPLGVGFELAGRLGVGGFGYDVAVSAGANVALGIDCTSGCKAVSDLSGSATGTFKPIVPSLTDFKEELAGSAFGWAKLSIGNAWLQTLQFEAVEAKAGLKQELLLATPAAQVSDPTYASRFKLSFDMEAGTGETLQALAGLLNISLVKLKIESSTPLAESPRRQSFTISPAQVHAQTTTDPGEKANFILTLDPVTYLGAYAIDSVELYRKKPNGPGAFTLEKVPGGCGQIAPSNGQSAFTCETTLPASWAGDQSVYAFVKPKLFGVSLPLLLEIAEDAMATVKVDTSTVAVVVSPTSATIAPAGTQQFTATVTGVADQSVTWTATGGTISSTGLYTAGAVPGSYTVTATSVANSSAMSTAQVSIGTPANVTYVSNNSRAEVSALASAIADNGTGYGEEYSFNETTPVNSNALTVDTTLSLGGGTVTDGKGAVASALGIAALKMTLSLSPSGSLMSGSAIGSVSVQTIRQNFAADTRGGATASTGSYFEIRFTPRESVLLHWIVQGQDPCGPPFVPVVNTGLYVSLEGPIGAQPPVQEQWVGSVSVDRELRLSAGSTYTMTAVALCSGATSFTGDGSFTTSFTITPAP